MPWFAFLSFSLLNHWTPGPNNITAMTNGVRFGLKKSWPFLFGMLTGLVIVGTISAVFTSALLVYLPAIKLPLKLMGASYMLWLAYKTFKSSYDYQEGEAHPPRFSEGLFLQAVNAKMILFLVTVYSQYILPYYTHPIAIASFIAGISVSAWVAHIGWAAFGSAFEIFLHRYTKIVNVTLALLLVYCAVSLFL